VVGTSDDEIWHALQELRAQQGGFIVVADGKVLGKAPLRIGGIMSEEPYETFLKAFDRAEQEVRKLGCRGRGQYPSDERPVPVSIKVRNPASVAVQQERSENWDR